MKRLGIYGLGRMGSNMALRLMRAGIECVVMNRSPAPVEKLREEGAIGAFSLAEFMDELPSPRAIWIMVPASVVDDVIEQMLPHLMEGDILIDGGNTHYPDDIRRARDLSRKGVAYVDVGTSGGIWGLERGYCLMIGGDPEPIARLTPIFEALAPGGEGPEPESRGFLHCGGSGAGHFVKMVHNGIEYGIMQSYAEGFNLMHQAASGIAYASEHSERLLKRNADHSAFQLPLPQIAELWRHGSVIGSWLLDLTALALKEDPKLSQFSGHVSDSGEGRWTIQAAVEAGVPSPVLAAALFARFSSRGNGDYANRLLSAMRMQFGGHKEPTIGE